MANEIAVSARLALASGDEELALFGLLVDMTGAERCKGKGIVGTTEEAIPKGPLDQVDPASTGVPGYILIKNTHASGVLSIRPATGGTDLIEIPPGGIALFKFKAAATAPFIISDTLATTYEYFLLEA